MFNAFIWLSLPSVLVGICLLAWWRGAGAEQYGSLLILAADIVADIFMAIAYPKFPGLSMCIIDFGLASGLLFIAFRFSSFWLGGAMILQSVALCLQAFDFVGDGPSIPAHYLINDLLSYAMVACLVAGLAASWQLRKRQGPSKAVGGPTFGTAL